MDNYLFGVIWTKNDDVYISDLIELSTITQNKKEENLGKIIICCFLAVLVGSGLGILYIFIKFSTKTETNELII